MMKSLREQLSFGNLAESLLESFQGDLKDILGSGLSSEEQVAAMIEQLADKAGYHQVEARRADARRKALKNADTEQLEPLEAAEAQKAELVALGAEAYTALQAEPDNEQKKAYITHLQDRVQALQDLIEGHTTTYEMEDETFNEHFAKWKRYTAEADMLRTRGAALVAKFNAKKRELEERDRDREAAVEGNHVSATSILEEMQGEVDQVSNELHSDKQFDSALDPTNPFEMVEADLARKRRSTVNDKIMAEFAAAAAAKGA